MAIEVVNSAEIIFPVDAYAERLVNKRLYAIGDGPIGGVDPIAALEVADTVDPIRAAETDSRGCGRHRLLKRPDRDRPVRGNLVSGHVVVRVARRQRNVEEIFASTAVRAVAGGKRPPVAQHRVGAFQGGDGTYHGTFVRGTEGRGTRKYAVVNIYGFRFILSVVEHQHVIEIARSASN